MGICTSCLGRDRHPSREVRPTLRKTCAVARAIQDMRLSDFQAGGRVRPVTR
jgi:hypothetical protein